MNDTTEGRESHRFASQVAGGGSEEHTHKMQEDATVEQVTVRFYPGPRRDLHITPFVERESTRRKDRQDLVELHGKDYIDGDNDLWVFDVSHEVEKGDTIGVHADNVEPDHDYDFICDVAVDYAGGTSRFGGLLDRLRGLI